MLPTAATFYVCKCPTPLSSVVGQKAKGPNFNGVCGIQKALFKCNKSYRHKSHCTGLELQLQLKQMFVTVPDY